MMKRSGGLLVWLSPVAGGCVHHPGRVVWCSPDERVPATGRIITADLPYTITVAVAFEEPLRLREGRAEALCSWQDGSHGWFVDCDAELVVSAGGGGQVTVSLPEDILVMGPNDLSSYRIRLYGEWSRLDARCFGRAEVLLSLPQDLSSSPVLK